MNKKADLSLAMDSLLDNFSEFKKNKIMIIDANTGQGKTTSAIAWIDKILNNKEYWPRGIDDIKFFYFTPQKNNWPVDRILEFPKLRKSSAFLFSQNDTFDYVIKQYKAKGSTEKTIKEFLDKTQNAYLDRLVKNASKSDPTINEIYETYKLHASGFARSLFDDKYSSDLRTATSFRDFTEITKVLVNAIYKNNKELIQKELIDKNNKALSFLYDLYSSMTIFDKNYSLYIASMDKMLHPLETIIHGKLYLSEIREKMSENTLFVVFIDEWDKAYERFSNYYYAENSQSHFKLFKTLRKILSIDTQVIPGKFQLVGDSIKEAQKHLLSLYPYLKMDIEINQEIKMVIKNNLAITNYPKGRLKIKYLKDKNINEIMAEISDDDPLEDLVSKTVSIIINLIKTIKENIKEISIKTQTMEKLNMDYFLTFTRLHDDDYLNRIMENNHKYNNNIILVESKRNDLVVTTASAPTEEMLRRLLINKEDAAPTLLIGMSATANYNTVINNFKIQNIGMEEELLFDIPSNITASIRNEYKNKNNYNLRNSKVEECVVTVGKELEQATSISDLTKLMFKNTDLIEDRLRQILKSSAETNLIIKELNDAIAETSVYTLKGILSIAEVLFDAKKKNVKNMILFSTNSYQKEKYKVLIKYIHVFRLLESGLIKTKEELINALTKEILFINADSFNRKHLIKEAIDTWDNCYIITSYSSASRGVNLMYSIKEKDLEDKLVKKISQTKEEPKVGEKMDIQAIYLQKPTFIIPKIPTNSKTMNEKNRIEVIDILFRLAEAGSISTEELIYWNNVELGIINEFSPDHTYPSNSLHGKIAAMKTAVQAIGRRTRTPYRFNKCYTYIDYDFLFDYPWELTPDYSALSESEQVKKLIEAKKG